jgi:trehalose utilization protein
LIKPWLPTIAFLHPTGCCFSRGKGRIFYFSRGHETYPVYDQPDIRKVIASAVEWAYRERPAPVVRTSSPQSRHGWFEVGDGALGRV